MWEKIYNRCWRYVDRDGKICAHIVFSNDCYVLQLDGGQKIGSYISLETAQKGYTVYCNSRDGYGCD